MPKFLKKEFYINKIKTKKITKDQDQISKDYMILYNLRGAINPENIQFNLSQNQSFKGFLSPQTPYKSALIFRHEAGKTCTAISIAEQYKNQLKNLIKK